MYYSSSFEVGTVARGSNILYYNTWFTKAKTRMVHQRTKCTRACCQLYFSYKLYMVPRTSPQEHVAFTYKFFTTEVFLSDAGLLLSLPAWT